MNNNKKYGRLTDKQREDISNFIKRNKKSIDSLNQVLRNRENIYGYTNDDFLDIIYEGIINAYRSDNPRSHKNTTSVFRHCHWVFKRRCTREKLRNYGLKQGQEPLLTVIRWDDYVDAGASPEQIAKAAQVDIETIKKGLKLRDECRTYRTTSLDNLLEKSVPYCEPASNSIEKLEDEIDRQRFARVLNKFLGHNKKRNKVIFKSLLEGYRLSEVQQAAKELGISQPHFYQLRRSLIKRFKRMLDKKHPKWREEYNGI